MVKKDLIGDVLLLIAGFLLLASPEVLKSGLLTAAVILSVLTSIWLIHKKLKN